ncbi:hypothetical protein E4M02_11060 [Brevundimonas sp. S30B]|uniref:hypothetical protein n=1 Tax=unclassified Brevundimonas TaxID=2622653 RepID=UPI0010725AC4|nr:MULTISPECIES: hypothetical protein [unclassified Brevundimonas]QBX38653.1 hypothetical protein E4M01_13320 [Brevundimonas sp. MF30-B]TFW01244.1 hypothetical protein E4M02_11060 [Brevundimonas sp. S30B]
MSAGLFATARKGALTSAEVDRAKAAIGPRATPSMIAKYLGRPVVDVQGILSPADGPGAKVVDKAPEPVTPKKPLSRRDREFVTLWESGATFQLIGDQIGVCRQRVPLMADQLGLQPRPKASDRWSAAQVEELVDLCSEGRLSHGQIARKLKRTKGAVEAQLRRARDAGLMPRAA